MKKKKCNRTTALCLHYALFQAVRIPKITILVSHKTTEYTIKVIIVVIIVALMLSMMTNCFSPKSKSSPQF